MMNHFYKTAAITALFSAATIAGCNDDENDSGNRNPAHTVESISLKPYSLALEAGQEATLSVAVAPDDATGYTVTWKSDDDKVATVSDGTVTAVAEGETVVTATAGGKSAACTVTVTAKTVAVESVELNLTELNLQIGETAALEATVKPDDATDKVIAWKSDDDKVATVDGNGRVTAAGSGRTTVTASAGDKSARCTVNVAEPIVVTAPPLAKTDALCTVGTQIWSDVINDPACNKEDFNGGANSDPLADGRNNDQDGYLYSWPYVQQHAAALCPDGWRVPTADDFAALDKALGGTGENDQKDATLLDAYVNTWAAAYGGYGSNYGVYTKGSEGSYWSQSEANGEIAYFLKVSKTGGISPKAESYKSGGRMLRCVRDE